MMLLESRPQPCEVPAGEQVVSSTGRWVEARALKLGDVLLLTGGVETPVTALSSTHGSVTVYNITVEGTHTYTVGSSGVLVHNKAMPIKRTSPNQMQKMVSRGKAPKGVKGVHKGDAKHLEKDSTANLANGRVLPRNLREQLAVEEVMSNPLSGKIIDVPMTDPRWHRSNGWVKMTRTVKSGGEDIQVHYVRNTRTGDVDDFKIVLPGAD